MQKRSITARPKSARPRIPAIAGEIGEKQGKDPMCRGSDIALLKDIRRNGGRHGNKLDGLRL
jgi:hypothetical protein